MNRLLILAATVVLGFGGNFDPSLHQNSSFQKPKSKLDLGTIAQSHPANSGIVPGAALGWSKCPQSAESLASDADKSMSWIKGLIAVTTTIYKDIPDTGHARSLCTTEIKDSSTFHIEFPIMTLNKLKGHAPEPGISRATLIADGKNMGYFRLPQGYTNVMPVSKVVLPSDATVEAWSRDFPRLVFSAIRGGHPFSNLVHAVRKSKLGLAMTVEERRFDYKGQIIHQKRLNIVNERGAKTPPSIEIVFDASRRIPVTIQAVGLNLQGTPVSITWSASWRQPKAFKTNPQDFYVPSSSKSKA